MLVQRGVSGRVDLQVAIARLVAGAVGILGIGSWLVLAAAHRDDLYRVGFVAGAWLELVRSAAHGVLYPPLFDGHYFGGTRYMPLTILLMSGLTRITHDELLAARLVTDASAIAVALLVYHVFRAARVPISIRLLLIGALAIALANDTLTVHGDLLSVGLQLGALALVARSTSPRSVGAGRARAPLRTRIVRQAQCSLGAGRRHGMALSARPQTAEIVLGRVSPTAVRALGSDPVATTDAFSRTSTNWRAPAALESG